MTKSARARTNIFGLIAIVMLSSATMLWLFWRFPVSTGIATIVVLSAFGISARLARWIDTDNRSEIERSKQSA
ncbi:MAG: hypothetical protein JWN43_373 [Gammaproteobacteria bacterium]|nr:hypothetical protein [Gammaproteobacteria bacterium]